MVGNPFQQLSDGVNRNAVSIQGMDQEFTLKLQALEVALERGAPELYEIYKMAACERIAYRLTIAEDHAKSTGDLEAINRMSVELGKHAKQAKEQGHDEAFQLGVTQALTDLKKAKQPKIVHPKIGR